MADGNEALYGALFGVERTLGALVPDQNERRRPLR
jgi:hypothetical protein